MPISSAAPLSSDTARIALPILVLPVKNVSASMITMFASTVTIASPVISRFPLNSDSLPIETTEVKFFGLAPQIRSAIFCKR